MDHLIDESGQSVNTPLDVEDKLLSNNTLQVVHISPEKNIVEKPALPPLTLEQDAFVLAMIECGGNLAAAYRMAFGENSTSPGAKAQALMTLPQVTARINELNACIKESTLVSIGMHLQELAVIRDMAKTQGQLKIALQSERARGEVSGLYNHFEHGQRDKGPTNIQINLVSRHDVNI